MENGKRKISKDRGKKNLLKGFNVPTRENLKNDKHIVFSFLHFCKNQGATFKNWEKEGKLRETLEMLEDYSKKRIENTDKTYTIYGDFPPNSEFTHPSNVPEDACWARIHVNGNHIIGGHIIGNVFYIVFLDSNHKFWITKRDLEH
jgi:hypothetical protein